MGSRDGTVSGVTSTKWVEHDDRLDKSTMSSRDGVISIRYRCRVCEAEFEGSSQSEVVAEAEGHTCLGPGVYIRVK
jgi:hypothetical protein